jgi:hypothetical protein
MAQWLNSFTAKFPGYYAKTFPGKGSSGLAVGPGFGKLQDPPVPVKLVPLNGTQNYPHSAAANCNTEIAGDPIDRCEIAEFPTVQVKKRSH